jgi:hypothetical protein
MRPNGRGPLFKMMQMASDSGYAAALVHFSLDLLFVDGEELYPRRAD